MNAERARQIVQAKQDIIVNHKGVPVWIDKVDEQGGTARVHDVNNPANAQTVAVTELQEAQ